MLKRFILLSAFLLLLCTNSWAQLYTTHISGRILPVTYKGVSDNTTLQNFTVALYKNDYTSWDRDARRLVATVPVASDGAFIFLDVIPDYYVVEPQATGYYSDPAAINVTVKTADVDNLIFRAFTGMSISGRFRNIFYVPQKDVVVNLYEALPFDPDITQDGETNMPKPDGELIATTSTNEEGRYTFTCYKYGESGDTTWCGLKPGSYRVKPVMPSQQIAEPTAKNVNLTFENLSEVNFVIASGCSETYITFPFWGKKNQFVDVFGLNFGPKPTDNSTVEVTLSDGTTTTIAAGVYFGTNDPATWVKAKVYHWSDFDINVKVPSLNGRLVRVWAVKPGLTACINLTATNFFYNTRD